MKPSNNEKEQTVLESIIARLDSIKASIDNLAPPKPQTWYQKLHTKVLHALKYIGIPALILTSVLPILTLTQETIKKRNETYYQSIYQEHINDLLKSNQIDRATEIINELEEIENLNIENQYLKARILISQTIKQGKKPDSALDKVNILLALNEQKPFFFPSFGGEEEIISLNLDLVDIHTQTQNYEEALAILDKVHPMISDPKLIGKSFLKRGAIDVLTYKSREDASNLEKAESLLEKENDNHLLAEAKFQIAKHYQFSYKYDKALEKYAEAENLFRELNSQPGLIKTLNNKAMIKYLKGDYKEAQSLYEQALRFSRNANDKTSIARALVNLGGLFKKIGETDKAYTHVEEAKAIFDQISNPIGKATALGILSELNFSNGKTGLAIRDSKEAETIYIETQEIRNLSVSLHKTASYYFKSKDYEQAFIHYEASKVISKYFRSSSNKSLSTEPQAIRKLEEIIKISSESDLLYFKIKAKRFLHELGKSTKHSQLISFISTSD